MKDLSEFDLKNNLRLACGERKSSGTSDICGFPIGKEKLLIIAGPCRVENLEQIEKVAKCLAKQNVQFLRAGAYKPATFPYASPGSGVEGLQLLSQIAKEYDLRIVSEVMAISQIAEAEKYIDVIQVGARNMQNFDLLVALAETGKPILLKRHPGASLRDWLGAAEWIMAKGESEVVLCERGVNMPHTHSALSRWGLDITSTPAIKGISHLPVIVDPSHSGGIREYVPALARAAVAAGADGVMVEIHPTPEKSASDPDQAISLEEFSILTTTMRKIHAAMAA